MRCTTLCSFEFFMFILLRGTRALLGRAVHVKTWSWIWGAISNKDTGMVCLVYSTLCISELGGYATAARKTYCTPCLETTSLPQVPPFSCYLEIEATDLAIIIHRTLWPTRLVCKHPRLGTCVLCTTLLSARKKLLIRQLESVHNAPYYPNN